MAYSVLKIKVDSYSGVNLKHAMQYLNVRKDYVSSFKDNTGFETTKLIHLTSLQLKHRDEVN